MSKVANLIEKQSGNDMQCDQKYKIVISHVRLQMKNEDRPLPFRSCPVNRWCP